MGALFTFRLICQGAPVWSTREIRYLPDFWSRATSWAGTFSITSASSRSSALTRVASSEMKRMRMFGTGVLPLGGRPGGDQA